LQKIAGPRRGPARQAPAKQAACVDVAGINGYFTGCPKGRWPGNPDFRPYNSK